MVRKESASMTSSTIAFRTSLYEKKKQTAFRKVSNTIEIVLFARLRIRGNTILKKQDLVIARGL